MQKFKTMSEISAVIEDGATIGDRILCNIIKADLVTYLVMADFDHTFYEDWTEDESVFQDYIGGLVCIPESLEDLEGLKLDGVYCFDRVEFVHNIPLVSLARVTNNAGGDLYYTGFNILKQDLELSERVLMMKRGRNESN